MAWFWRIIVLVLLGLLLKNVTVPPVQAFIFWSPGQTWTEWVQWQVRAWQQQVQDLPASLELEIRRFWQEYRPSGNSEEV